MSSGTRNQEYQYQYKIVSVADVVFIGPGPTLSIYVPDDLLELKGLFVRVRATFDVIVPTENKKIHSLGGVDFLRLEADATGTIDVLYDFSHILNSFPIRGSGMSQPYFDIKMVTNPNPNAIEQEHLGDVTGKIVLWKAEWIYTTKGIL